MFNGDTSAAVDEEGKDGVMDYRRAACFSIDAAQFGAAPQRRNVRI